jgi:hypothetical protein
MIDPTLDPECVKDARAALWEVSDVYGGIRADWLARDIADLPVRRAELAQALADLISSGSLYPCLEDPPLGLVFWINRDRPAV